MAVKRRPKLKTKHVTVEELAARVERLEEKLALTIRHFIEVVTGKSLEAPAKKAKAKKG